LPNAVVDARARFESWWFETTPSVRQSLKYSYLFEALSLNARIYRVEEAESTQKPNSMRWVDEAIRFFENAGESRYIAESYLEKAAVLIALSDLQHTKPDAFSGLAEQGEKTMRRASELASEDQKAEVYRLWSRFCYNLARPRDGNLAKDWDNNFLLVAEAKMRKAYSLEPNELSNAVQLARVTQKAAANPPQDTSKEWTACLWDVSYTLKSHWEDKKAVTTDSRTRLAALNILSVVTMDAVLRSWLESPEQTREQLSSKWLNELDTTVLPVQREVISLIKGTELEENYDFDMYYDLARMHAVRLLVAESGKQVDPGRDMVAIEQNLASAKKGATTTQLQSALGTIATLPCFTNLSQQRRDSLVKILTVTQEVLLP
jgi:hypothetical protein